MRRPPTSSQTIGPFFHDALTDERYASYGNHLVGPETENAIRIFGTVYDGAEEPVPDAMLEVWQANPEGRYSPENGFGRCATDPQGSFSFVTVKPGAVSEGEAPHVWVSVFARGLLKRLVTRIYFPDEGANDGDTVLALAGDAGQRETLISSSEGAGAYRFDIRLQGEGQTAFFDFEGE